jgi:hypothetical protein
MIENAEKYRHHAEQICGTAVLWPHLPLRRGFLLAGLDDCVLSAALRASYRSPAGAQ